MTRRPVVSAGPPEQPIERPGQAARNGIGRGGRRVVYDPEQDPEMTLERWHRRHKLLVLVLRKVFACHHREYGVYVDACTICVKPWERAILNEWLGIAWTDD